MALTLALALALSACAEGGQGGEGTSSPTATFTLPPTVTPIPTPTPTVEPTPSPSPSDHTTFAATLYSPYAILVNRDTGEVVMEKNAGERIYPASLTKIMTALVCLENIKDLNTRITLREGIFPALYEASASMAGFLPGEVVPAIDLIYGVLLPSGAECCVGLSEYIAGSEAGLVELMNERAQEMGLQNTHFTNTTGLQDADHYTTAEELAKLLDTALKNETFREIFTSRRRSTAVTNLHPEGITFYSTMFSGMESPSWDGGEILGGKTGFTSSAGQCLASLARVGEQEYLLVTAGAQGDHKTEQYHIQDAFAAYEGIRE